MLIPTASTPLHGLSVAILPTLPQPSLRLQALTEAHTGAASWRLRKLRQVRGRLHATSPRDQVLIVGLDVLCDTSGEAAAAAVSAAREIWPEVMAQAEDIELRDAGVRRSWVGNTWDGFSDTDAPVGPRWLLEKVKRLQSCSDAEWELPMLARVCLEEALSCRDCRTKLKAAAASGSRPLTVGELEANWAEGAGLRESLLGRWGITRKRCEVAMHSARFSNGGKRLACKWRFFPGLLEAIHVAAACSAVARGVYVITSRDAHSAKLILEQAEESLLEDFPESEWAMAALAAPAKEAAGLSEDTGQPGGWRLFSGLGSAQEKAEAVWRISTWNPDSTIHLLEDSVAALRAVAGQLRLGAVRLHYAAWGRLSGRWAEARSTLPRVRECGDVEFFEKQLWSAASEAEL